MTSIATINNALTRLLVAPCASRARLVATDLQGHGALASAISAAALGDTAALGTGASLTFLGRDTYNDLGAIITGPEQGKNLGIKTLLNGALVSDIVLDTSTTTTDTIDYVVTDQDGLTSTSTRTVIIEPAAP